MPRSSRGMTATQVARAFRPPITNACAFAIVRARHITQPGARETGHGKGSDAQQQGKEETEGRQEPQEGRRDALAVRVRQGADAGRPEPLWQEELRSGSPVILIGHDLFRKQVPPPGQARGQAFRDHAFASAEQNAAVSVMMASPAKCSASQERCAASPWPAPPASVMTTGIMPRSAAWRAVGSIPISIAMPAIATPALAQSRKSKASGVPPNADIASLSKIASLGPGP